MLDFNLDDPDTWPDDIDELEKMSKGINSEDAKKADDDSQKVDDKDGLIKEAAPDETPGDKKTGEPEDKGEGNDVAGVMTRDGKHFMPYSILENSRERTVEAETQLSELQKENKALQEQVDAKGKSDVSTDADLDPKPADTGSTEDAAEQAKALRELAETVAGDLGEEYAVIYKTQADMLEANAKLAEQLKEQGQYIEDTKASTEKTHADSVQDAIDASPVMSAWQADKDDGWYTKAGATHQSLIANDKAYAAKSAVDQMKELPARVEALYGKSPHSEQDTKKSDQEAVDKALEDAGEAAPTSMSDLPAGDQPDGSDFGKLEGMSGAAITSHLENMAPDKLEAFLRTVT